MMLPVLYSFRRCPYAMRARLALAVAAVDVELREVVLRNKPQAMLDASPKGTVPVLLLPGAEVIDESLDIMLWAFRECAVEPYSSTLDDVLASGLVARNDGQFKHWLDRYKYADRYPEKPADDYREQAMVFIAELDTRLEKQAFLMGEQATLADLAIMPFVRQFAHVDREWFFQTSYLHVQRWLQAWLDSPLFQGVMQKYAPWEPGGDGVMFPG